MRRLWLVVGLVGLMGGCEAVVGEPFVPEPEVEVPRLSARWGALDGFWRALWERQCEQTFGCPATVFASSSYGLTARYADVESCKGDSQWTGPLRGLMVRIDEQLKLAGAGDPSCLERSAEVLRAEPLCAELDLEAVLRVGCPGGLERIIDAQGRCLDNLGCERGARCEQEVEGCAGVCVTRDAQPCGGACEAGSYCDGVVCKLRLAVNQPCDQRDACVSGAVCDTYYDTVLGRTRSTCRERRSVERGGDCGVASVCEAELICDGGKCAPPVLGKLGASCLVTEQGIRGPCEPGLLCTELVEEFDGLRGECGPPRELGEPCTDYDCAAGLVCLEETLRCAPPVALGGACRSELDCAQPADSAAICRGGVCVDLREPMCPAMDAPDMGVDAAQ